MTHKLWLDARNSRLQELSLLLPCRRTKEEQYPGQIFFFFFFWPPNTKKHLSDPGWFVMEKKKCRHGVTFFFFSFRPEIAATPTRTLITKECLSACRALKLTTPTRGITMSWDVHDEWIDARVGDWEQFSKLPMVACETKVVITPNL